MNVWEKRVIKMGNFSNDMISSIFADTLKEVIATTTGFSFEISSQESGTSFEDMTGLISLNGNNPGMIFISADERAMRRICSFMTGLHDNDITMKDIEDALCELVNMTAGSAKLRFNTADDAYFLSPPFILRGNNMSIISKKRVNVISMVLGNEEISIKLKVVFY